MPSGLSSSTSSAGVEAGTTVTRRRNGEIAENVRLDSEIVVRPHGTLRFRSASDENSTKFSGSFASVDRLVDRHLAGQVPSHHLRRVLHFFSSDCVVVIDGETMPRIEPFSADVPDERASVDIRKSRECDSA